MMETTEPKPSYTRQELREISDRMLKEGIEKENIIRFLLDNDIDADSAYAMLNSLSQGEKYFKDKETLADKKEAPTMMIIGGLLFVGGAIIIVLTHFLSKGQYTFIAAWVSMIVGLIQLVKGFINSRKKIKA